MTLKPETSSLPQDPKSKSPQEYSISIKNLKKSFDGGKEFILKGINLEIQKGSITVIIGFSGTGKSVLMKHILGLEEPTEGEVFVLGQNLWEKSKEDLFQFRRNLGVLFQHAALFDDMTAIENVEFPVREHMPRLSDEEVRELAGEKLLEVGLKENDFHKMPSELSGGMKKRVGLARALSLNPQIMIYDEPTTGLDPILTEMVDELIYNTHRRLPNATSLVISHDLHAAFSIGDRIVMLHEGKVLYEGIPEDFLKTDHPIVKKFVQKGVKKS